LLTESVLFLVPTHTRVSFPLFQVGRPKVSDTLIATAVGVLPRFDLSLGEGKL
jgi:hypothetical protein